MRSVDSEKAGLLIEPRKVCKSEGRQIDDLNEDLFQATKNNYIIDIGWYPEMNSEGKLIMNMIKDFNWSQPEKSYDVICYNELVERIEETIHS